MRIIANELENRKKDNSEIKMNRWIGNGRIEKLERFRKSYKNSEK